MDALDFVLGLVQRDPKTLQMAQSAPDAVGQVLDHVGTAAAAAPGAIASALMRPLPTAGMAGPGGGMGNDPLATLQAFRPAAETAMGVAYPEGPALMGPGAFLPGGKGLLGGFDPITGVGRVAEAASGPISQRVAPPAGAPADLLPLWRTVSDPSPLSRLAYGLESAREAEHRNSEQVPGLKGLGEMAADPTSYIGWGLPGRLAARVESPLLRQILGTASEMEGAFTRAPGAVLGAGWYGAQQLPGIGGALQQSKRAAAGIGEDAMRGVISGLETAGRQFPELEGTNPWRLLAGLKGVTKAGQQSIDEATAGLAASGLDKSTLKHWGDQASQDKELGRKLVGMTQRFTPAVTEPIDLVATRSALEAKAGITAADTDALLREALPRVPEVLETPKQPEWYTSADLGKALRLVQDERLAAQGSGQTVNTATLDLPAKAAQAAWLAERYGDVIPATVGRGAVANEAAVLARANRAGGAAAPTPAPAPAAAAPSAPASDELTTLRQAAERLRPTEEAAPGAVSAPPTPAEGNVPPPPSASFEPSPGAAIPGGAPPPSLAPSAPTPTLGERTAPGVGPAVSEPAMAGGAEPPVDTAELTRSLLRMQGERAVPGTPEFQAKLVQDAPNLVARYEQAKTATDDLLAQTGAADLRALTKHEDPAIADQAQAILKDMGGADPSKLPEQEVLSNAWTRDYMASKGVRFDDPNMLQKAASEVMQYWRQQALFAPAFFVRNQVDAMTRMLIYTGTLGIEHPINPLKAGDADSFWQIWKRAAERSGQEIPDATAWHSAVSYGRGEIHGVMPSPGVVGGMAQQELQARRGFERWPLGIGRAFRTFRELYTAQEQAMREAGYWYAYEDAIPQALPKLTAALTEALGENGRPVLQVLQDTQGYLSPKRFSDALGGANVSPEARVAAETAFGAFKQELDQAGTNFTNKLFINYKDTTNADEFLRNFLGFHVFATRSIPFYVETLATHPGLLHGVQMFQQEQKEKNKRAGTTKNPRLRYAVDLPAEDFVTALFGQNGMAMVDPTGYVSLVQAPLQAMDENPNEPKGTTLLGSVLNQLQRVGVSPAPWVQVPLQMLGAYGGQQPANILRVEPLVEAAATWATGQPVEAPWNALQRQRVGPGADRMPNDPAMTVRLKLREMALEQDRAYADANPTNPISPRFRQAMIAGPSDPLWREAASLVGRQQFLERGTSFVTGAPTTFRSDTAAATDAIQAGLPEVNAQGGSRPLEPVIPNPGVKPGTPLETYTLRERRLQNIAATGHPEAAGMREAFQRNLGEPGGPTRPSDLAVLRDAVQQEYRRADPTRKAAMLTDPRSRLFILQMQADDIKRNLRMR